jgi:CheY-like chemotaxis protein
VNNKTPVAPLVLAVDDNAANLKLTRDVLLASGFRVLEATTGADALELAGRHLPHVILMDLRLPDMGGDETARMLAADPRTAAIPVVAFSSLAVADAGVWARHAGFAGYIEKPIDVELFPAQVRDYCR